MGVGAYDWLAGDRIRIMARLPSPKERERVGDVYISMKPEISIIPGWRRLSRLRGKIAKRRGNHDMFGTS